MYKTNSGSCDINNYCSSSCLDLVRQGGRIIWQSWVPTENNGPQFVRKLFKTFCTFIRVKQLTTKAYHPQTNGQADIYSKTIVTHLRHPVAVPHHNWDWFVQPLTYAYNNQVYFRKGMTLFSLGLTLHPPGLNTFATPTALPTYANEESPPKTLCLWLLVA